MRSSASQYTSGGWSPPMRGTAATRHRSDRACDRSPGEAPSPVVLADVLALELVLGQAMQGRGQVGHRLPEAAVLQVEVVLVPGPAQVQVSRLLAETTPKRRREGGGALRVVVGAVPHQGPVGEHREDGPGVFGGH